MKISFYLSVIAALIACMGCSTWETEVRVEVPTSLEAKYVGRMVLLKVPLRMPAPDAAAPIAVFESIATKGSSLVYRNRTQLKIGSMIYVHSVVSLEKGRKRYRFFMFSDRTGDELQYLLAYTDEMLDGRYLRVEPQN